MFSEESDNSQNNLGYKSELSEILGTVDGSDLNGDCVHAYTDEAANKTNFMMGQMSDALSGYGCNDTVTSVTQAQSVTSLGSQVSHCIKHILAQ